MPSLRNHQSNQTTKLLFCGDSGAGKSGALASLAAAGYNLRIMDLDNGLDVLKNILSDPKSPYGPKALDRVAFETLTDPMHNQNGKLVPRKATVWQRAAKLLDNWKTESDDFGPITTWTTQEILVIDSLTYLSLAAMNFVLSLNGRLGQQPQLQDWYSAQQLIESLLQMLYDEGVKCNVIVSSHVTYIEGENGVSRGYPNTLGKALPPKVGRYFNTILLARSSGSGQSQKRKILCSTSGMIELKNTAPNRVKAEYDLATGLAEYFADVRAQAGAAGAAGQDNE